MDRLAEEQIRKEIGEITDIPYRDRTTEDKQRLNALEAELLRRDPARNTALQAGKYRLPMMYCERMKDYSYILCLLSLSLLTTHSSTTR
jgi:hypothetical protein